MDSATGVVQSVAIGADTIFYTAVNSCGSESAFLLDTVRMVPPTDSITGAVPICVGFVLTLSSTGGGLAGTWASGSPLVATVSGGVVTAAGAGNAIISYTVSTACGLFTDTAEVKVYPVPAMVALADQAVCNGGVFINIFNSTSVGSTFTWSNNDTSVGLGFSGAGDTISFTATNHTDSVVSATVLVVPTANGCIGAADTFVIAVEPTPILSGALVYNICDSSLFNYVPATTTAAVTYAWRRDVVAGIANAAGNGVDTISEVLDNTTALPVVVTYIYTLTVNGCTDTQVLSVTVNPQPLLTSTLTPTEVCSHRLFSYSPAANIAGATFNWHRSLVPGISNFAASGTDNPNEILRNTTDTFVTVSYTFTTAAFGCSSVQQVKVIVRPMPVLQNVPHDTLCSGTPFTFTASAAVAGTTFVWSRPLVTGIAPATGSGTISINDTLTNTTFTRLDAVYIYTLTANGCAYTQNVVLTVDPYAAPFPLITTKCPANVCSNTLYQNFGTSHIPADINAQYKWTASNAVVHATGNNDQYCLVSFPYPGDAVVTVTANVVGINCYLKDTFAVAVSTAVSENPTVIYLNNTQFVCLPSDEDTYQWGYDNPVLDSTIITGETSQEYVNVAPNFNNYYWVMTTHNGCSQKSYYIAPVGVHDVAANVASVNVYPNPTNQNVTIELAGIDGITATAGIYDIAGHMIISAAMPKERAVIDVQQLPPGVYLVGCYLNGVKLVSARFVKN